MISGNEGNFEEGFSDKKIESLLSSLRGWYYSAYSKDQERITLEIIDKLKEMGLTIDQINARLKK